MFFLSRLHRLPAFFLGMREVSPQSPGIAAWGLMTGVAMVKSGMSVFEASAMTLLVFAGSSHSLKRPTTPVEGALRTQALVGWRWQSVCCLAGSAGFGRLHLSCARLLLRRQALSVQPMLR